MAQPTIDSVANELYKSITEEGEKKLEAQVGLQKLCILGNYQTHETQMTKIAEMLCNKNYPATLIKRVPGGFLPDFEKERKLIEKAAGIVIIDTDRGGAVGESTYLIQSRNLLDKAVLLVPDSIKDDVFFCTKRHYVYYQRKVKYAENSLVDTAVMAAIQLSHNLAIKELQEKEIKN